MRRSRSFTQSVLLGFFGQAITMIAGMWLSPFLLHRLGAAGYGIWIVGQQVLVYLALMDLGVVALLPREIASATGSSSSPDEIPALVARTMRIVLLQTPALGILAAALWLCIPRSYDSIRDPVGWAALAVCLLFPVRIFRAVLEGLQDLAFNSWSYMAAWLAGLLTMIASVQAGFGLRALAMGWAANQLVDATLSLVRIRVRFPQAWPHTWSVPRASGMRTQFGRGLWISVSQIAQVLIYGTDAAIIGRFFGAPAVVPYNCTGRLITALQNQPQHIMRSAGPGLSELRAGAGRDRLKSVTSSLSFAMLLASGLVATLALAVNPGFVRWWIGDAYFAGLWLTVLFTVSMLLRHLNITAIYALFAFGHERLLAKTSLADGVLSTIFSILFAWRLHSAIGIVLGSILSTCCVFLFGNGRRLARELGVSQWQLAAPLTGWFWRMLLAGVAACLLAIAVPRPGPVSLGILAFVSTSGYALVMFPVLRRSSLWPYLQPYLEQARRHAVVARVWNIGAMREMH